MLFRSEYRFKKRRSQLWHPCRRDTRTDAHAIDIQIWRVTVTCHVGPTLADACGHIPLTSSSSSESPYTQLVYSVLTIQTLIPSRTLGINCKSTLLYCSTHCLPYLIDETSGVYVHVQPSSSRVAFRQAERFPIVPPYKSPRFSLCVLGCFQVGSDTQAPLDAAHGARSFERPHRIFVPNFATRYNLCTMSL